MTLDIERIIDDLAEKYPGPVGVRSIWELAGGSPADIEFTDSARSQWAALWQAAAPPGGERSVALLREVLFDHPGEVRLLAGLDSMAANSRPDAADAVPEILLALTSLGPAFDAAHIRVVLEPFPECTEWEAFAAFAPRMQGAFEKADREALEKGLAEIRHMQPVLPSVLAAAGALMQSLWATTPS